MQSFFLIVGVVNKSKMITKFTIKLNLRITTRSTDKRV